MRASASPSMPYQVLCICGGHGFPRGTATGARITMIGRALQQCGLPLRVLHCGPSPAAINTDRSGVHEGIPFQYTTTTNRPQNKILRVLVYIWAVFELTVRVLGVWPKRRSTAIYLYLMEGPLVLYIAGLCRLIGFPLVQELCEWYPGEPRCSRFNRWLYSKPIFQLATGALVISKAIEERVRERCAASDLDLLIHRVPALVDAAQFVTAAAEQSASDVPEFLYCGTWCNDLFFLIRALSLVKRRGYKCRLRLMLGIADTLTPSLLEYASAHGLSPEDFIIMGYVDQTTLARLYKESTGLLMPLWSDDRSITRLPNKMSEYLASGRPIITSEVGDLTTFLTDGVSAYIATPGDEHGFADKMIALLENPSRASNIGTAGQQVCLTCLDFRQHATALSQFFTDCIQRHKASRLMRRPAVMFLRNVTCGALALAVFLSGRVRKARREVLNKNVVTAIYFHQPNKALFLKCVRWLKKHGYTFISTRELINFINGRARVPRGAVWLSFDDGSRGILESVVPIACEHKVPITLFIPSGIVAGDGLFPWLHGEGSDPFRNSIRKHGDRDAMTLAELKEIASRPEVTIGSHTVRHAITADLSGEQLRFEVQESKRQLESWIGAPVTCFAYPVGQFDGRESEVLSECGYEIAVTTEARLITRSAKRFEVPRFHVGDNIPFIEAICNIVGVWRPIIDRPARLLRWHPAGNHS